MVLPPMTVRALATAGERERHCQFADQAFSREPSPASARDWYQFVTTMPGYRPEQLRGAFRNGEQVGSYSLHERSMHVGTAQLLTGCIGAVVTYPEHRRQGVATALMQDAIDYAQSHGYPLLLLDGIPKFYDRYVYDDVFDVSVQDIDRAAVLAQPSSPLHLRPVTLEDAEHMVTLYNRHFGPLTGSFTRTVEWQHHRIQYRSADNPLWLAVDAAGRPQGYLALQGSTESLQAQELAADTWAAALALLQHHAHLLESPNAPTVLRYRIPLSAPVLYDMIDALQVPDTSHWRHPPEEWAIRNQTYHHRFAAWMARLVSLPALAQALLPEWQARWQQSLAHWTGTIALMVDADICTLHFDNTELQLIDTPDSSITVRLSAQRFIQLVFGYRPVASILRREAQSPPAAAVAVLNVLFPYGQTWIPVSDWF
jgi:GNAT superfamily N-acetyltransferase